MTIICDDSYSSNIAEDDPTPPGIITHILFMLRRILRHDGDFAELARYRAHLATYLRVSDREVLPEENVFKLTGEKLELEIWVTKAGEVTPKEVPDVTDVSQASNTTDITEDINYIPLVADSIECTRRFPAWKDSEIAPICRLYKLSNNIDNKLITSSDLVARIFPALPAKKRPVVEIESEGDLVYKSAIMKAKPNAVFFQEFNSQSLTGKLIVANVISRELLTDKIASVGALWHELYEVVIAGICIRHERALKEIETIPVLRYRDSIIVIENYQGLHRDIIENAPIARDCKIGEPTHIDANNLAAYCSAGLIMERGASNR